MLSPLANAQTGQLVPEIDFTYKLTSVVRASFQAKATREAGEQESAEIGPSIELYLKPLVKLKSVTLFDLDDTKSRPLVFSIGYRYLPSPDSPSVHRMEPTLTFHFPIASFLLSDKNRGDLRLDRGQLLVALSQSVSNRKKAHDRPLSPRAVRERGVLLPKQVWEME